MESVCLFSLYFVIATVISGYFSYRFVKEDLQVNPVLDR